MAAPSRNTIRSHYDIEYAVEHLYDVTILGKPVLTTVIKHAKAVTEWIKDVQPDDNVRRYVGFEMKMVNPYIGATVQLCVGNRCLVIQFLRMPEYPPSLSQFLVDQKNLFFSFDAETKIQQLGGVLGLEGQVACADLGELAGLRYPRPDIINKPSLSLLTMTALGMRLQDMTGNVETDWDRRRRLSHGQVLCASIEAFVSFSLGKWLILD